MIVISQRLKSVHSRSIISHDTIIRLTQSQIAMYVFIVLFDSPTLYADWHSRPLTKPMNLANGKFVSSTQVPLIKPLESEVSGEILDQKA